MKGRVKFFNDQKGFGFIEVEGQKQDTFVHYSAIRTTGGRKTLNQDDKVEFDVVDGPRGLQASNVVKL